MAVTCSSASGDLNGIGNAYMAHKTAGGSQELPHIPELQVILLYVVQELGYADCSAAGRCHRTLAADVVIAVNHSALSVGRDRNTAPYVTDHIIAFFVLFAQHFLAVTDSGLLQIQGMQMDHAVDTLDTGHAGDLLHLIRIRRIDDHRLLSIALGKGICQLRAQRSRMDDPVCTGACMLQKQLCHGVCTAFHGQQAAAAADKYVYRGQIHILLRKQVQNSLLTVRKLVRNGLEFCKLRSIMGNVFREQAVLAFKQGNFGGSGARVDGQNAILFHLVSPFFAVN